MDEMGVDAFIFTGPDFFQFVSNFHTDVQVWERPIFAVLPRDGSLFLVMNELSMHHVRYSLEGGKLWTDDICFWSEHPRVTQRLPLAPQLPAMLAERLRVAGLARSRIAVEGGNAPLTAAAQLLPDMRLRPATAEARSLRWQKHPEELAVMEALAATADWLQERYRENIRPGRLVQELDFAMSALWVEEAARRFPGEHFEVIRAWSLSGPASASPHGDGRSCGARIEKGHGLVNILIPRLNGLAIENERTWFCGKPSTEQVALWTTARDATEAAIGAAVTGQPRFEVWGSGAATRDFIYVTDVAEAIAAIVLSDQTFAGETFNLGSGVETSVREMAELIAKHSGQSVETIEADSDRDRWFTADEARGYGLIDHVYSSSSDAPAAKSGKGKGEAK